MSFFGFDVNLDARQLPVPGIVNDIEAKRYLIAPDYWTYWDPPGKPYFPVSKTLIAPAPPALWWAQREDWREGWERLGTGEQAAAVWPYEGRKPKGACYKDLGLQSYDSGPGALLGKLTNLGGTSKPGEQAGQHWWKWLELPEGAGGKRAKIPKPKGPAAGQEEGCPEPVTIERPAGQWLEETLDPGKPPKLSWPQEQWMRENSLRRPTLPGFPHVLTRGGIRNATPRLPRFAKENEPATIDPRLPRPAPMVDPSRVPRGSEQDAVFRAYDGKQDGGGFLKASVGEKTLEFKAFRKLLDVEPDWMSRFMSGKIVEDDLNAGPVPMAAKPGSQSAALAGPGASGASAKAEDEVWHPPPPPDFAAEHRDRWRGFWRALEGELRWDQEGQPAREAGKQMTRRWHELNDRRRPLAEADPRELMRKIGKRERGAGRAEKTEVSPPHVSVSGLPPLPGPPAAAPAERPEAGRRLCAADSTFI